MAKKQKEFEQINSPNYDFDPRNLPQSFDYQETDWMSQHPLDTNKISAKTFQRIMDRKIPQDDNQFCQVFANYLANNK